MAGKWVDQNRATKWPTIDRDHDGKIRLISTPDRSSQGSSVTAWGIWYAPDNARLYHHSLRCLGCWPIHPGLIILSRVQPKLLAFQGLVPSFLPLRRREENSLTRHCLNIILLFIIIIIIDKSLISGSTFRKFLHRLRSRQFCHNNSKKLCPHSEYRDR